MEKICIVKRRREYTQPEVKVTVTQPEISETIAPEVVVSSVNIEKNVAFAEKKKPETIQTITPEVTVSNAETKNNIEIPDKKIVEEFIDNSSSVISITMTREQSELLQQSEYIKELLSGRKSDPALDINITPDGRLSLNYRFNDSLLIRMLAPNQVCQMLQVSRSFLQKLIHENKVKSYKLGRMRRFLLEDILEYLSNDAEFAQLNNEK
ncbi:MAG: helix-turn-helix domain-containing protein [Syntrophaceae bacterium]|nr:helix-turn-helix domain-containing protein [Syntrophaceae bacterium]